MLSLEMRGILLFDLSVEFLLHLQVIQVFYEETFGHAGISLGIKVKQNVVDEPSQIDAVGRCHDLEKPARVVRNLVSIVGIAILVEIELHNPGLDELFGKEHGLIGSVLLLDPEDGRNARLVFLSIRHTGKHIVKSDKEFAVLLPVPSVPGGIKGIDQDVMPAHVR